MKKNQIQYITCPQCNAEYLPEEVFVTLLDKTYFIDKTDDTHQITNSNYNGQVEESFICNYCNTKFKVIGKLTFTSFIDNKFNFNEAYKTQLKSNLILSEDVE